VPNSVINSNATASVEERARGKYTSAERNIYLSLIGDTIKVFRSLIGRETLKI
jgi:hypothetical protein